MKRKQKKVNDKKGTRMLIDGESPTLGLQYMRHLEKGKQAEWVFCSVTIFWYRLPDVAFQWGVDFCSFLCLTLNKHNIEARIVHPKPRTLLQLAQPKVNLQNATQKPAQSNTLTARGPMWFMKSRVNFVGNAMLYPPCVPSTAEQENTPFLPKIKRRPRPWVLIERTQEVQPQTMLQDCLRHGERQAAVENRRGAG